MSGLGRDRHGAAVVRQTSDYTALVTPQHADKPRFLATVAASVDPLATLQSTLLAMELAFDLDSAVGVQLDAVGIRVGSSRLIPVPIQGVYFSFGDSRRGWGRGIWFDRLHNGSAISSLDDDTFRRLIRAKVLANRWDGTLAGLEAIYDAYFTDPATLVFVSDDAISSLVENYFTFGDPGRGWGLGIWAPHPVPAVKLAPVDMRITVGIAGKIPNLVDLAILNQRLVGAKPEGVRVDVAVTSKNGAPVFGFGSDNAMVGGWGHGAWAVPPSYLLTHLPS